MNGSSADFTKEKSERKKIKIPFFDPGANVDVLMSQDLQHGFVKSVLTS